MNSLYFILSIILYIFFLLSLSIHSIYLLFTMSNYQQNLTMPTTSNFHPEDDMMSESGSTVSLSSSSHLPSRIQKLVARLASLEEEMVRTDLSKEEIIKTQNSYTVYSKSLDMILGVQKKLSKKDKVVISSSSSKPIGPSDLPLLQWMVMLMTHPKWSSFQFMNVWIVLKVSLNHIVKT